MTSRPRIRAAAKWATTAFAGALVVITVCSRWWGVGYSWTAPSGDLWTVALGCGTFGTSRLAHFGTVRNPEGWRYQWYIPPEWDWGWTSPETLSYTREAHFGFVYELIPRVYTARQVTLLYPILLATATAALLWRVDRRERRRERSGHCLSCNYDRCGLHPNAPCPECGSCPAPTQTP